MPNPTTMALARAAEASERFTQECEVNALAQVLTAQDVAAACGRDAEVFARPAAGPVCPGCTAGHHSDPHTTVVCCCPCHEDGALACL